MGKELTNANINKEKIVIYVLCRVLIVVIICLAGVRGISGLKEWFSTLEGAIKFILLFTIGLIWGLYPLIHLRDSLVFWENGIAVNGKEYLFETIGSITFCDYNYGIMSQQFMKTDLRNFNVTYIKRPKKAYNEAYLNNK